MDTKDLKGFLYGWLGKQKLGQPSYTTNSVNRGGTQRFKCELRVPGHSYTGLGNSMNKKDAMTNAAMDFCNYLVRQGSMQASEVPALNASSLEATSAPVIGEFPPPSGGGSFFGGTEGAGDTKQEPWSPAGPNRSVHDRYVTQKAEEIAQSESIDLKADIHGGWTMENCKSALNELMQKMRQPAVCYNTQLREANMCRTFVTTVAVFIPQLGKNVSAQGQGSSKKVAEAAAAMSLVRQLFHLGIMAAFKGDRKRTTASNLPEIPLQIAPDLSERVRSFVEKAGVVPAAVDPETCTAEEPKSLMIDCKLAHFPDSEVEPAGNVSWAPPMLNWNPWRAANIDELPLSVMNLPEISSKINEKEAGKFRNQEMIDTRDALPVHQFRDQIVETVRTNQVTLIKGETGCGKSTQVAQFLLDAFVSEGKGAEFNAFVSQPRRISAITLAERVANEREETLGESVGYGVRFDSVSPRPYGAIMFCTVGVLLRKMESGLRGVSHVIIDEIHERDVNTDFVLVVLREMVREYSDLRIILMSATIDTQLFTEFFGKCPVIEMHGRTHPVKHFFLEDIVSNLQFMPPMPEKMRKEDEMEEEGEEDKNKNLNVVGVEEGHVKQAMSRLSEREIPICVIEALLNDITKRAEPGSVLVFLPGWNEIMLVMNHLNAHPEYSDTSKFVILPLHSQLTGSEQRKVFDHFGPNIRKIILSTNIAETSVTIDDVVYVIDSCKAKERMYTSNNNMVHFATVWASRTNLTQRRGRAGRVRPGYAFHLCSKARFEALDEHRTAEILRTPLHEIALTIKLLRLGSVGEFLSKAIEPPPYDMVVESEAVLQNMGALDRNLELTPLGRILARLPIEPIMGKTIVLATSLGIGSLMCQLAAGSSFSSPFVPRERSHTRLSGAQRSFAGDRWSDHVALINVNQQYQDASEQGGPAAEASFCQRYSLSPTILKMTGGACRQLLDIMCNQCGFPTESLLPIPVVVNGAEPNLDLLTSLLVSALYPNICFFRGKRKVYTLEQASAIVSKTSVLTPFKGEIVSLPSPLIVFTEKIRTRVIACKELSVISAVQLLLFGCRKVECIGKDLVRFDDMVTVRMDVSAAAAIVALRPCVEALMVRTCTNPEAILAKTEEDIELGQLVRDLSSSHLFADAVADKDYLLTDRAAQQIAPPPSFGRGRGGRGGFAPRGAGSHNGWGMSAGPPRGGFNGGGGWNSGGGKWNSPPRGHGFRGTPYPPRGGGFSRGRGSRGGSWF